MEATRSRPGGVKNSRSVGIIHGVGEDAGGEESPESWLAMWDSKRGETTAVATNRGGEVVVGEGARGGRRAATSSRGEWNWRMTGASIGFG